MLVLSRKKEQKVSIGDSIEVKILNVGNGKVRLGITAPKEYSITRDDVSNKEVIKTNSIIKNYRQMRKDCKDLKLVNTICAAAGIILNLNAGVHRHEREADAWGMVELLIKSYYQGRSK